MRAICWWTVLTAWRGTDHHPELDDLAGVVAPDDVDAVDVLALHGGLELEHGGVAAQHLLRVAEGAWRPLGGLIALTTSGTDGATALAGQGLSRRLEIELGDRLALLGREHDGREEHDVVVQQLVQPARQLPPQVGVPTVDHVHDGIGVAHAVDGSGHSPPGETVVPPSYVGAHGETTWSPYAQMATTRYRSDSCSTWTRHSASLKPSKTPASSFANATQGSVCRTSSQPSFACCIVDSAWPKEACDEPT